MKIDDATSNILFNTGNTTSNAYGNVGVETDNPTAKLDVNGQIRMRSGSMDGYIIQGNTDGVMSWVDPSTINTGSALPGGLEDETIYHDGTDWTSSTFLANTGDRIKINGGAVGFNDPIFQVLGTVQGTSASHATRFQTTSLNTSGSGSSIYNNLEASGAGATHMGIYNRVAGTQGFHRGIYNFMVGANSSGKIGTYSYLTGGSGDGTGFKAKLAGTGNNYGISLDVTGGSNNYAVYAEAGESYFEDNMGIGTVPSEPSAILDVNSTTQGVLLPSMTEAQRDAIAIPATGLLVFQTDNTPGFYYYDGSSWTAIAGGGGSSTGSDANTLIYTTNGF
jgi:hypothetical protein